MKPERGQYRSITVVLLDGPDFQALSPEARWVFTALKISLGPCGIEVEYPDALIAKLAARTGYSAKQVAAELAALEDGGWIRRERNVVWIVKQLEFEPAMTANNEKHRAAVLAHVKGLPRLAIVGDFIRQYQAYLPGWEALLKAYPRATDTPPIAYLGATDSLSNHRDRNRDKTETESAPPAKRRRGARTIEPAILPPGYLEEVCHAWEHRGVPNRGLLGRVHKSLVRRHGPRQVLLAWRGYLDDRRDKEFCHPMDFATNYEVYRRRWGVEVGEDGTEIPIPDEPVEVPA